MSALSASKLKRGGLTTLELQAQNIVQDDESDGVEVTDEAKYNALVESKKSRRAVSPPDPGSQQFEFLNFLHIGRVSLRLPRKASQGLDADCPRPAPPEYFLLCPQQDGLAGRPGQSAQIQNDGRQWQDPVPWAKKRQQRRRRRA